MAPSVYSSVHHSRQGMHSSGLHSSVASSILHPLSLHRERTTRRGRGTPPAVRAVLQQDRVTVSDRLQRSLERHYRVSLAEADVETPSVADLPLLEDDKDYAWHFAYGANMNYETLARRGVKVKSRDPAFVRDPTMRIVFKHRGGYSTLERLPPSSSTCPRYPPYGNHVHGVLYHLSHKDLKELEKREGGYTKSQIEVQTYDGRLVKAWAFVTSPMALLNCEVAPTERYMRLVREGAADNYIDPLYQAWLSSIETVPSAGLGPEYWETPSKYVAYGFLLLLSILTLGVLLPH